jgi:phosphotransferase family enzyme
VNGTYVGRLAAADPLHAFLERIVRDRMGIRRHAGFRVFRLSGSNEVYAYEERGTLARIIGKFFGSRFGADRDRAAAAARQEYESLHTLRGYGLLGSPHHVVDPLGFDRDINCVLALEHYSGEQLSAAIDRARHHGDAAPLYRRLGALAYFLATQHNRTANGATVDFDVDRAYLDVLLGMLRERGRIGPWDVDEVSWLGDLWRERPRMWQDRQVWLHGDATPANFLFGGGLDVAAIDLERCKRGDRVFDVGRVAGELQHAFLATGHRERAEPFIGHFLREYSGWFPDREAAFRSVTGRLPYFMALNLLRIARNDYISDAYGSRLVDQAKTLLRAH